MARTKKYVKSASGVCLWYKPLAGGKCAVYLKYRLHDGTQCTEACRGADGKVLHLVAESVPFAKQMNDEVKRMAEALRATKIIELMNGVDKKRQYSKMLLTDWIDTLLAEKLKQGYRGGRSMIKFKRSIMEYKPKVSLADIDKNFVLRYQSWLGNTKLHRCCQWHDAGYVKRIGNTAINGYVSTLNMCLNMAVRRGYIESNPFTKIERNELIKADKPNRGYLTLDELTMLENTTCVNNEVKRAFLFSCYCGLRFSDVQKLVRGNIVKQGERFAIDFVCTKTQKREVVPLGQKALAILGDYLSCAGERLFGLPTNQSTNLDIKKWAKQAGITKNVTFHIARHTFATSLITKGADVYKVSKLMGHSDVKVTMVYAEVVNKALEETIDLLD